MVGTQVTGKRLGIISMGRVGQVTARRARAFEMDIHYANRSRLGEANEAGATYHETIEGLLPHCDFLSIHCPATPETEGLLNTTRITLLPDGAVVVNTARGSIVDDGALIDALRSGKLFAAGLDVYNNEPEIDPAYRELDNFACCPTSAAPPGKPATPWGSAPSITWMRWLPAASPATGWRKRLWNDRS